ncbi:universal stress protein [Synechocystis sp. PCC 7339]|uniref:universal stress protein n=1 Tax=unclassified Synechocystis TaxID=2640012 RepID=UPI001BAF43D4|nr:MULTISPECIES: universal stress protein [unclassified Synechocystis]QUS60037.1 universal stress protein [Synechocystis sp. PCC 7338]UAJ72514.1 universal stress protein [Synechocystis sp. PCC 7339]
MLSKILYADSGTSQTQEMLKAMMDFPAVQKASITILHVVPPQITTEAFTEKWAEGGKILADLLEDVAIEPSKVSTVLRQGDPKGVVCDVANEIDADLIIMGSRGLKRLEAILENSVSQYVFQLTNHPMLLVKDDIYVKRIKRVMVALDKSAAAQYALELALELLRDYPEGELILARVNPDLKPDLLPLSRQEIEENPVLAPAIAKAKRLGVAYRCTVTGGKPGEKLCELAEDYNADLILLGSPDRRPSIAKSLPDLDRLLGTSLSDYIRVNAPCPVLLARKEGI